MVQTIIFDILCILIILTALMIVLVGTIGILRIVVVGVFEFDFIVWFKTKPKKTKKIKIKTEKDLFMGLYKGEENEN